MLNLYLVSIPSIVLDAVTAISRTFGQSAFNNGIIRLQSVVSTFLPVSSLALTNWASSGVFQTDFGYWHENNQMFHR